MDYFLYGLTVLALFILLYRIILWIAYKRMPSDILMFLAILGFLVFVNSSFLQETPYFTNQYVFFLIVDWSYITAIVSVLIGLGLAIRESKPKINQSPQILSFLPVLLLIVHPLIQETLVIRELLLDLYTLSAFLIAIGLLTLEYFRRGNFGVLLSGTCILFAGFIIQRYEIIPILHHETGQLLLISGILVQSRHYRNQLILTKIESYET